MKTIWIAVFVMGCSTTTGMPVNEDGPDAGVADPAGADAGLVAEHDGAPPDTPVIHPGEPGPYPVGVRTIEVIDVARSRSFLVDVWYPSVGDGAPNVYELPPLATIETSPASISW